MLLSPRKTGLDSLFKEVRVFKVVEQNLANLENFGGNLENQFWLANLGEFI